MSLGNPLLELRLPIPFGEVRAEHIGPGLRALIAQARERLEAIAAAPGERTYANTLAALDRASETLDWAAGIAGHLESTTTTPPLREAWNDVQPDLSAFYSSIPLHAGLWRRLREYAATEDARRLEGVRARFLEKTLDNFRRHGADLDPAGKKRLELIDIELAVKTNQFAQNVLDATAKFELAIRDEAQLAGLPEAARLAARQSAEAKGIEGWRFTLQQPSYHAAMTYLDDAAIRETLWRAHNRRAAGENAPLIARILELRRGKAKLLGFAHFADYATKERMAGSGAAALAFLRDLRARTEAHFARENAALRAFRREREGCAREMNPWDVAYWAEKQRAAEYEFEEEDLRPYFPVERVIEGLFELAGRLFGIRIEPAGGVPVWHPEVKYYEIRDEDGALLGSFYADWHPRESKRGGAWMGAFHTGGARDGRWEPHVGVMCGNLTAPLEGRPALLTHREAETVFHEFGHLLHHCLSRVEVRSLSGTNVAWDFVELPSQIMENWCWEREPLGLFARHWRTGAPIPEELFAKMRRARAFRGASAQMRQLGFAIADLALHMDYDPARDGGAVEYANRILQEFSPAPLPEDCALLAGFTHLFADPVGYGAGYYSYKWAEVLDADAFTRFRAEGVFSREAGLAFRRAILEPGGGREPAELFRAFMGRDPDPGALLERLGLTARPASAEPV
jgi:oligopeptidase A